MLKLCQALNLIAIAAIVAAHRGPTWLLSVVAALVITSSVAHLVWFLLPTRARAVSISDAELDRLYGALRGLPIGGKESLRIIVNAILEHR